jgi:hypothetical protein
MEMISTQGYVVIAHGSSRVFLKFLNTFHILRLFYVPALLSSSFEASLVSSENMAFFLFFWKSDEYSGT